MKMIHWCEKLKPGAQRAVLEANETQEVVRINPIPIYFYYFTVDQIWRA